VRELVEVAVRSLSPSLNDPFTAMNCIDYLSDGLCALATLPDPLPLHTDDAGHPRLQLDVTDFEGLLNASFHQIRQNATGKPSVLIRLLEALGTVAGRVDRAERRAAIRRHAELVWSALRRSIEEPADLRDAEQRYIAVLDRLRDGEV
jgi:uncharacterized membrane protein